MGAAILNKDNFKTIVRISTNKKNEVVLKDLYEAGKRLYASYEKFKKDNLLDIKILHNYNLGFLSFIKRRQ